MKSSTSGLARQVCINLLHTDLLWRILASFSKIRIKNNKTARYGVRGGGGGGGNGGMTTQLWLLLIKGRGISTGRAVWWHPQPFLFHQRTKIFLGPKMLQTRMHIMY